MSATRHNFDPHAFCALPLVRRAYQGVVVGVAVFLVTLVGLREPFRGYLAEVQIAGPATPGLDLDAAAAWLKQADRQVAAVATPAGEISAKSQIRATYVASRPATAAMHLDELAERWLYQYLPDRLQTYRHRALADLRNIVQSARAQEDAAQQRLESLRQRQLALMLQRPSEPASQSAAEQSLAAAPVQAAMPTDAPGEREKSLEKLYLLRLELSQFLASFTDEHPQVVTLRSQIVALEKQIGIVSGEPLPKASAGPELGPPAVETQANAGSEAIQSRTASHFVSMNDSVSTIANRSNADEADARANSNSTISAEVQATLEALSRASRERQEAEHQLSERMQEIASQPTAAQWSAAKARLVTRLGGTPRSSTLALAGLVSGIAGIVMFRAAAFAAPGSKIATTGQLAGVLELPIVGNLSALRAAATRIRRRLYTPGRVWAVLIAAEIVVGIAVVACLMSIAMEPSLGRQVLADPFGTLSEVLGRFGY
jgi:hypothetical protein